MSEKDEQLTQQESPDVEGHVKDDSERPYARNDEGERPMSRSDDESPDFEGHAHFRKGRARKGRA